MAKKLTQEERWLIMHGKDWRDLTPEDGCKLVDHIEAVEAELEEHRMARQWIDVELRRRGHTPIKDFGTSIPESISAALYCAFETLESRITELSKGLEEIDSLREKLQRYVDLIGRIDEEGSPIRLSFDEFMSLLDYSSTLPTGVVVGKRWKRQKRYGDDKKGWLIGEYVDSRGTVLWRSVTLIASRYV